MSSATTWIVASTMHLAYSLAWMRSGGRPVQGDISELEDLLIGSALLLLFMSPLTMGLTKGMAVVTALRFRSKGRFALGLVLGITAVACWYLGFWITLSLDAPGWFFD